MRKFYFIISQISKKSYLENVKSGKSVIKQIVNNPNKDIKDPADFFKEDVEEDSYIK